MLAALVRDLDDESPLLVSASTTLARPWELLDPATLIRGGELHVAPVEFNNMRNAPRITPLPGIIDATLGGRDGSVYDVLGLPPTRRGMLIERHRMALSELELEQPVVLEQLVTVHLAALLTAAPTPAHVQATFAAAGIPAHTVTAARLRAATVDELPPTGQRHIGTLEGKATRRR